MYRELWGSFTFQTFYNYIFCNEKGRQRHGDIYCILKQMYMKENILSVIPGCVLSFLYKISRMITYFYQLHTASWNASSLFECWLLTWFWKPWLGVKFGGSECKQYNGCRRNSQPLFLWLSPMSDMQCEVVYCHIEGQSSSSGIFCTLSFPPPHSPLLSVWTQSPTLMVSCFDKDYSMCLPQHHRRR
jgi:hypothetical protein